jgi:hypothetical protein
MALDASRSAMQECFTRGRIAGGRQRAMLRDDGNVRANDADGDDVEE